MVIIIIDVICPQFNPFNVTIFNVTYRIEFGCLINVTSSAILRLSHDSSEVAGGRTGVPVENHIFDNLPNEVMELYVYLMYTQTQFVRVT